MPPWKSSNAGWAEQREAQQLLYDINEFFNGKNGCGNWQIFPN